jgi:hypothetical protein
VAERSDERAWPTRCPFATFLAGEVAELVLIGVAKGSACGHRPNGPDSYRGVSGAVRLVGRLTRIDGRSEVVLLGRKRGMLFRCRFSS